MVVAVFAVVVAVFAARSVVGDFVFPPFAVSVADGAVRSAASGAHPHVVFRVAGVAYPAAAEVSAGLSLAARIAFPAAAGISGPPWDCPCSLERGAAWAADPSGESQ